MSCMNSSDDAPAVAGGVGVVGRLRCAHIVSAAVAGVCASASSSRKLPNSCVNDSSSPMARYLVESENKKWPKHVFSRAGNAGKIKKIAQEFVQLGGKCGRDLRVSVGNAASLHAVPRSVEMRVGAYGNAMVFH